MVIEKDKEVLIRFDFTDWFFGAAIQWLVVLFVLFVIFIFFTLLISIVRRGPKLGFESFFLSIIGVFVDLFQTKPRRILAIASLAFKESLRSRIFVVLLVFLVILAFTGWFLDRSIEPAKLYISFVITSTSYLVLMLALFLSVFSIPNDIKNHTVYTLVTKPLRATEIIIGRTLGFIAIGTILLGVMAAVGYLFIDRMLNHTHEVQAQELTSVSLPPGSIEIDPKTIVQQGRLKETDGHFHTFTMNAEGQGITDTHAGHWHLITKDVTPRIEGVVLDQENRNQFRIVFSEPMDPLKAIVPSVYQLSDGLLVQKASISDDNREVTITASAAVTPQQTSITLEGSLTSRIGKSMNLSQSVVITDELPPASTSQFEVSKPIDMFRARVPKYGTLKFRKYTGEISERGISVGNIWGYHSYISGGTQAAAIWQFDEVTPESLNNEFPLELSIRVFRTRSGKTYEGVQGNITLVNPITGLRSTPRSFTCQNGEIERHTFARQLQSRDKDGKTSEIDLFDDLVADGKIQVVVQCLEDEQYFGMAKADAYLMQRDASYGMNYFKGFLGVWLQMCLVISFGVMLSTFLSGPIAMLACMSMIVFGIFRDFIERLPQGKTGKIYGGGPLEQFYRIVTHMNSVQEIKDRAGETLASLIQGIDWAVLKLMQGVPYLIPSFDDLNYVQFVADGFDIQWSFVLKSAATSLGYMIPVFLMGYYFFKHREVAA